MAPRRLHPHPDQHRQAGSQVRHSRIPLTGQRLCGAGVRIQVKSTTSRRPEGCYKCNVRPARGRYKRGDFDFLAVYVIPEDLWYIIPAKCIVIPKKSAILLYTTSPTSRWAPYKEAWDQLRNHRRPPADRG